MARAYVKFRTTSPQAEIPVAVTVTEVGSHGVYISFGNIRVAMMGTGGDIRFLSYLSGSSEVAELRQMGIQLAICQFDNQYRKVQSMEQNR